MMPLIVFAFYADQGEPQDYAKEKQFNTRPCNMAYLTAFNKSAGTVYIQLYDSASGASGTSRELPCPANSYVGWSQIRMRKGIFVRAVTAAGGSTAIAADDVKYDAGWADNMV